MDFIDGSQLNVGLQSAWFMDVIFLLDFLIFFYFYLFCFCPPFKTLVFKRKSQFFYFFFQSADKLFDGKCLYLLIKLISIWCNIVSLSRKRIGISLPHPNPEILTLISLFGCIGLYSSIQAIFIPIWFLCINAQCIYGFTLNSIHNFS